MCRNIYSKTYQALSLLFFIDLAKVSTKVTNSGYIGKLSARSDGAFGTAIGSTIYIVVAVKPS